MAITSPFRKHAHSRDGSREESTPSPTASGTRSKQLPQGRTPLPSQGSSQSRATSSRNGPPVQHLKSASTVSKTASVTSSSSTSLAQQYENDKQRLIKYCFSSTDSDGVLVDNYITHVRVVEDAGYPSSKPPASSPSSNKKPRILALAVKKDGSVHLHKGRENSNGSFQIGRKWSLNELSKIQREPTSESGFLCTLGKDYYWETNTSRERQVFITSFVRVYRKFKNGMVPYLENWDLSLFGLDENSYRMSLNKEINDIPTDRKASVVSVASTNDRVPISQSPLNVVTESPRAMARPPSPKKTPAVTSSVASATILAPTFASSMTSSRQIQPQASGPYEKGLSTSDKTRTPSASDSTQQRPSTTDSSRRPSALEQVTKRPSEPSPYTQKPQSISSSRNASNVPPPIQIVPTSIPIPTGPTSIESTKPLDFGNRAAPIKNLTSAEHVSKADSSPFDLENEINEQMKNLGIDTPAELPVKARNNRDAQLALDIPERYDPPRTAESESKSVASQDTNGLSVSETIHSVEIVAHRRNMAEFEEDEESSDDDITALYQDSSDQLLDSSVIQGENYTESSEPVPFPSSSPAEDDTDSNDFSFENSYGEHEESTEQINVTPKAIATETPTTIKANVQSDNEDDYDDLNESPLDTLHVPQIARSRRRANTMESVMETQDTERSSFDDIFDEINWDTTDDAESLTLKLMKELAETEYETTKKLIDVHGHSFELKQHTTRISDECNKLTPLLNLFAVELSGFSREIQHIEDEGQGLQVESTNKKNLWSELQTLLNTVSVDESSVDLLLTADMDRDLSRLEPVLADLESAINAIRGNEKGEEDLGDMKALKERRSRYDAVISQFLRRMRGEFEKRFSYAFSNLNSNSSDKDVLNSVSKLIVYAGITLFVKDMADDAFYDLVAGWEGYANSLYEGILGRINSRIIEHTKKEHKFTLSSVTAFKQAIPSSVVKKVSIDSKQNKLREKFGLSEPSSPMEIDQPTLPNDDFDIEPCYTSLQIVLNHVILQQDFLVKFFHMSSVDLDLGRYISKYPIEARESLLNSAIGEIDSDRGNARDISRSISSIFQPSLETLLKNMIQSLRKNQKNIPGVMLWVELFEKQFNCTDQEYLVGQFRKLTDRLFADWVKFVGMEIKDIEKTTLARRNAREVSIIVQNFCMLVRETEKTFAKTLAQYPVGGVIVKDLDTGKKMDDSYIELAGAILNNLRQEFEEKFSRFKLHEASETHDKMNYLVNIVQNSHWVMESLTPLKLPSLTPVLSQYQTVYKTSTDQYVHMLVDQHFGKVVSFVSDVDGLLQETAPKSVDPSKRNAYSKSILSKLLSNYTSREVTKIIHDLRQDLLHHMDHMTDSDIQRSLVDKMWSAVQSHFVAIVVRLESITERFYKDTELRFTKKDVVAAFNASRISH